ncbi:hypothetical protein ATY89_03690 [Sulfolobus acidocaldarius]|uniref:Uncharacterized protein n=4 Tax=Sulfolobus acidocaldarius TaxID=2285 RepID=Q4JB96_SULAC|nr:hypothetical protein [Sulfolobus acidocaldarius]AAY79932.1 hypothetical protein Saci_0533 [Sulfolobus acidocaldarius DSM 639]AGE70501.1 hypothetical protein SacN8_02615 [Sulfolobus acidocaldarius N8]AGE72774.1 hypothetical protein SacRon12I_02605 [Sulfolobus acidocaldarius Ron12/I]ALU29132.1 hypothetical protein ATY89_03690 [Sulfolobus acidocaldarius]ALU31858.1 hypothetical protein ATZ20_06715 [Sulfolobus acidocaldarius]
MVPFTSTIFNLNTALITLTKEEIRKDKPLLTKKEPKNGPIILGIEATDKNNPYVWAGLLDSAIITLDATEIKVGIKPKFRIIQASEKSLRLYVIPKYRLKFSEEATIVKKKRINRIEYLSAKIHENGDDTIPSSVIIEYIIPCSVTSIPILRRINGR